MSKSLNLAFALSLLAAPVLANDLGRPATDAEIAAWDIDVRPDGLGLPEGSGSVAEGEEIFSERCAVCHGDFGEAVGRWPVLAGGQGSLTDDRPIKTVGSYWPYLSTVWDFVHRAMPFGDAQSLEPNEVYAITAYIMYLNDMVDDEDFVLSKENFLDIPMPNQPNFIDDDRPETEYSQFTDACMENCKDSVEITKHAAVIDVTPEETRAEELRNAVSAVVAADDKVETPAEAPAETAPVAETPAETAAPIDADLAAAGAKVFRKCKACHQVGDGAKNRTGPVLTDVVGRIAGTYDGFKYSKPMLAAGEDGLVWTPENLDTFLTKPKDFIKGTKMSFSGLRKADDRAALIEYLRSLN